MNGAFFVLSFQNPQGLNHWQLGEETRFEGEGVNVIRGLSALCRVGKDIMDGEKSTRKDMRNPATVVGKCRLEGVPSVDEDHAERGAPCPGGGFRWRDNRDYRVFQIQVMYGLSEEPEGVYQAGFLIQQIRVEIFLPRLLFLGAPVVINGEKDAALLPAPGSDISGGFSTVASDLKAGADPARFPGKFVEPKTFFAPDESFYRHLYVFDFPDIHIFF